MTWICVIDLKCYRQSTLTSQFMYNDVLLSRVQEKQKKLGVIRMPLMHVNKEVVNGEYMFPNVTKRGGSWTSMTFIMGNIPKEFLRAAGDVFMFSSSTHTDPFTNPASSIHPAYWAMNFQVPVDIHPNRVDIFTLWQLLRAKTSAEYIVCHYVKDYQQKSWCTGWVLYPKMDKKLENKQNQTSMLWLIAGNSTES